MSVDNDDANDDLYYDFDLSAFREEEEITRGCGPIPDGFYHAVIHAVEQDPSGQNPAIKLTFMLLAGTVPTISTAAMEVTSSHTRPNAVLSRHIRKDAGQQTWSFHTPIAAYAPAPRAYAATATIRPRAAKVALGRPDTLVKTTFPSGIRTGRRWTFGRAPKTARYGCWMNRAAS
jgi:hypothetical protein